MSEYKQIGPMRVRCATGLPVLRTNGAYGVWKVAGTRLDVYHSQYGWVVYCREHHPAELEWLDRAQLSGARFPSRRELLLALTAAAAISPPPDKYEHFQPAKLTRAETGEYVAGRWRLTRCKRGWTATSQPETAFSERRTCRTLASARDMIGFEQAGPDVPGTWYG